MLQQTWLVLWWHHHVQMKTYGSLGLGPFYNKRSNNTHYWCYAFVVSLSRLWAVFLQGKLLELLFIVCSDVHRSQLLLILGIGGLLLCYAPLLSSFDLWDWDLWRLTLLLVSCYIARLRHTISQTPSCSGTDVQSSLDLLKSLLRVLLHLMLFLKLHQWVSHSLDWSELGSRLALFAIKHANRRELVWKCAAVLARVHVQ